MKQREIRLILSTAITTMTLTLVICKLTQKPVLPHHTVVVQDGLVDVWTQDQMLMKNGVLYVTFDPIREM